MNAPNRSVRAVDGVGVWLLALSVVAVWLAAARNGGTTRPLLTLILGAAAVLVVGRLLGRVHRMLVPAAVVVAAIVVAVALGPVVGGGPLGGPFGYRNATGAFYVQAVIAALMVAGAVRRTWLRVLAIAVALPFAIVAAVDSWAAGFCLVAIAVGLIGLGGARLVRLAVVMAGAVVGLVLAGTVVLGLHHPGGGGPFVRALTERRVVLWHESLTIIAAHPGGVGPGRFAEVDPTAIRDPDAGWAHNEFLQQGVELGWAGLVLIVLVFVWGFVRLWVHPAPDVVVALGAAALAALGIHACVDYVLHFPAVPLTAAALIGTAQAVPSGRFRSDRDKSRQESFEGGCGADGLAGAPASR